jgi:hypothetical protein
MPYDNQYNQDIANTVLMNNKRYIQYLESQGQNIMGSGIGNNASKCECRCDPCTCERGLGMSGGSGFASGTFMDTGYEPTIGAGMSGSKSYRKRGCGQIASMPPQENQVEYPSIAVQGSGKFVVKPVQDHAVPMEKVERAVGGRKKKGKGKMSGQMSGEGWNELKADLGKFDFNKIKDWVGLAKPPKEMKQLLNQVQLQRMPKKNEDKVVEKSEMQSMIGGKKGKGQSGGAGMSGGDGRKKRAEIVKKVMKEKGLKMIEASKYVKQHNLY